MKKRNINYFFLKFWIEFTGDAIWSSIFLFQKIFNYEYNFFN